MPRSAYVLGPVIAILLLAGIVYVAVDGTDDNDVAIQPTPSPAPTDDPVEPDPVEPDPAEPDPAEPDPAEPDPTEPDPTEPDPSEPGEVDPAAPADPDDPAADGPGDRPGDRDVADARPTHRMPDTGGGLLGAGLLLAVAGTLALRRR